MYHWDDQLEKMVQMKEIFMSVHTEATETKPVRKKRNGAPKKHLNPRVQIGTLIDVGLAQRLKADFGSCGKGIVQLIEGYYNVQPK